MFKVKENSGCGYFIGDGKSNYMHRDGEIIHACCEYWPTEELAQVVLDKYQPPKAEYVWGHGDIAITRGGSRTHRVFFNIGGKLRILDGFGLILTGPENVQRWATNFGYKKIGNVFEL